MAIVNDFRDLRVWQAGMDLVEQIYLMSRSFPKHEQYGLASQMQRAAVSIPSNIAEGHARGYTKEYLRHVAIAQGSLAELQTQIEIASRLTYGEQHQFGQMSEQALALSRQLRALRLALEHKLNLQP